MNIAIISDVHSNLEALDATLSDISKHRVDRIMCLGDVVGFNADPQACISLLRSVNPVWVAGNHDRAVAGKISTEGFSRIAVRAIGWTRERLDGETLEFLARLPLKAKLDEYLIGVHGALHPSVGCELVRLDDDNRRYLSFQSLATTGVRICAFGHTHRLGVFELHDNVMADRTLEAADSLSLRADAYYLINPGTVGQPRTAEQRATYMLFDTERQGITVRRVQYDRRASMRKTRAAGLASPFSWLPRPVRSFLRNSLRAAGLGKKRSDGLGYD